MHARKGVARMALAGHSPIRHPMPEGCGKILYDGPHTDQEPTLCCIHAQALQDRILHFTDKQISVIDSRHKKVPETDALFLKKKEAPCLYLEEDSHEREE
jgi:hypothetical protein